MKKEIFHIFLTILIFLFWIYFVRSFLKFKSQKRNEETKNSYINGRVDSILHVKEDHNNTLFRVKGDKYFHSFYHWCSTDSICIGDSLFKDTGNYHLKIIKENRELECSYIPN